LRFPRRTRESMTCNAAAAASELWGSCFRAISFPEFFVEPPPRWGQKRFVRETRVARQMRSKCPKFFSHIYALCVDPDSICLRALSPFFAPRQVERRNTHIHHAGKKKTRPSLPSAEKSGRLDVVFLYHSINFLLARGVNGHLRMCVTSALHFFPVKGRIFEQIKGAGCGNAQERGNPSLGLRVFFIHLEERAHTH
jgi:hypothetical protein